jgi:cardiolipin synthase A/B
MLPAPFIHSKAILVDDCYSLIGSANLDPRSLRLNFELGLEVFSEGFNQDLSRYFEHQLENALPLTMDYLSKRPKWVKIRDAMCWLFSPYL